MKRIYAKTPDCDSFIADLKYIDQQLESVQPDRKKFVVQDGNGDDVLVKTTKAWTIVYHGKMVKEKALFNDEGELTKEAVMHDGERADVYLIGDDAQARYDYLESEGIFSSLPNGSEFVTPNPSTPDTMLAGEGVQ